MGRIQEFSKGGRGGTVVKFLASPLVAEILYQ